MQVLNQVNHVLLMVEFVLVVVQLAALMDDWRFAITIFGQPSAIEASIPTIIWPQLFADSLVSLDL